MALATVVEEKPGPIFFLKPIALEVMRCEQRILVQLHCMTKNQTPPQM